MKLKKLLASFMAACMVATAVPLTVLAEDLLMEEPVVEESAVEPMAEGVEADNVAEVGNVKYTSLQKALNACTDGETVKLIKDITYDTDDIVYAHGGATGFGNYDQYNPSIIYTGGTKGETPAENKPCEVNAVIDLNGHSITNNADAYLFLFMDNAKVTFKDSEGGGSVTNTKNFPVIWVTGTETTVAIKSGEYVTANAEGLLWSTHAGDLVIEGGTFSTTADDASLLILRNEQDRKNSNYFIKGNATVTVTGGTFDYNPEETFDDSTDPYTEFNAVADGYVAKKQKNGTWIVGESAPVARIGDAEYYTLAAAAEAAVSGDTIELIDDVTIDSIKDLVWTPCKSNGNGTHPKEDGNGGFVYVVGKDITFDLNGNSIIYDMHDDKWCNEHVLSVFYVTDQGTLTIVDSSNGKGEVEVNGMATAVYSVAAGTKAIIEGGTWTWNSCKECDATNIFLYASHGGELYIKDGYFENNAEHDGEYMIVEGGSSKETTDNGYGVDYDETKVEISGGDYKTYDPSKSMFIDQGNSGAAKEKDCCADGYVSTLLKDGVTYRVHKAGTVAEPEDEPESEPSKPSRPSKGGSSSSKKYKVDIEDADDGEVTADRTSVKKGTTVTLTVNPDSGYGLDSLKVLDKDGDEVDVKDNGDGEFTFKMPQGGVTVESAFEAEKVAGAEEEMVIILTIDSVIAWVFDEYVTNDVAPEIKNDRTMLPIRFVVEALGGTVTWDEATQTVSIAKDDITIEIYINQSFALVNGEPVQLDAPAYIANDRTYLPLRFVAENLGATVEWNAVDRTVTIYE